MDRDQILAWFDVTEDQLDTLDGYAEARAAAVAEMASFSDAVRLAADRGEPVDRPFDCPTLIAWGKAHSGQPKRTI